ncbi:MAG: lpg2538 family Dot/Icm T4SS effector [Gammaproteobacteria bacterium]
MAGEKLNYLQEEQQKNLKAEEERRQELYKEITVDLTQKKPTINSEKPITENKNKFLQTNQQEGERLYASQISTIIDTYHKKYGINIYLNGTTSYGQKIISDYQTQQQQLLEKLQNTHINYAVFLQKFWGNSTIIRGRSDTYGPAHPLSPFFKLEEKIGGLKPYLVFDRLWGDISGVRADLTHEELVQLNQLLTDYMQQNQTPDNTQTLQEEATQHIANFVKQWSEVIADKCLNDNEAVQEISHIKAQGINQPTGYYFTADLKTGHSHFEGYILLENGKVIRPIAFPDNRRGTSLESSIPASDIIEGSLNAFVKIKPNPDFKPSSGFYTFHWSPPCPQASETECGTLSMLYLKELLKNNAEQLNEFTMIVPYNDKYSSTHEFFFPSPQVLRYSQSNTYNAVIAAMLEDTLAPVTVITNEKIFTVKTLKAILTENQATNKSSLKQESGKLLEQLPTFREKWLASYQEVQQQRDSMKSSNQQRNRYLNYKSIGLFDQAKQQLQTGGNQDNKQEVTSPSTGLGSKN